jgi:hypothetical protein
MQTIYEKTTKPPRLSTRSQDQASDSLHESHFRCSVRMAIWWPGLRQAKTVRVKENYVASRWRPVGTGVKQVMYLDLIQRLCLPLVVLARRVAMMRALPSVWKFLLAVCRLLPRPLRDFFVLRRPSRALREGAQSIALWRVIRFEPLLTIVLASWNNSTLRFSNSDMRSSFVFSSSAHFAAKTSADLRKLAFVASSPAHCCSRLAI